MLYKDDTYAKSYVLGVFTPGPGDDFVETNITKTIVKFNDTTIDTITCEVQKARNFYVVSKVWYNGLLKYPNNDFPNGSGRLINIVK